VKLRIKSKLWVKEIRAGWRDILAHRMHNSKNRQVKYTATHMFQPDQNISARRRVWGLR
jgi:hypothetical protein